MLQLWTILRLTLWKNFFIWTHTNVSPPDKPLNTIISISKELRTQNTLTKKTPPLMLLSQTKNQRAKWSPTRIEFYHLKLLIKDKNNKHLKKCQKESTILAKVRETIKTRLKIKTKIRLRTSWKVITVEWWTFSRILIHWKWLIIWVRIILITYHRVDQIKWILKSHKAENLIIAIILTFRVKTILYCHL